MLDQIESRLWTEHHEAFGDFVERTAASLRSGLQRFASWDGSTHQLLALVLAFAITALTFNATTTA